MAKLFKVPCHLTFDENSHMVEIEILDKWEKVINELRKRARLIPISDILYARVCIVKKESEKLGI